MFWQSKDGYQFYVGSSYGKHGLNARIYNNHQRRSYRHSHPGHLYRLLNDPDIEPHYICLGRFEEIVHPIVAFLAEELMVNLFGAFRSPEHQRIRLQALPAVNWNYGANRNDPLVYDDTYLAHKEGARVRRARLLRKVKAGGPFRVTVGLNEMGMLPVFPLFQIAPSNSSFVQ